MQVKKFSAIEIVLSLVSTFLLVSIFLKAWFDIDYNYDVGWYHHPFAARIWGIISLEDFMPGDKIAYRYLGFPLLAHFFQGMFWKLTGRVESTNLVSYLSIIIYFLFLKYRFKVPLHLSVIAILTIPTVITHVSGSLVDLPGNIAASVALLITYVFFKQSNTPEKRDVFIFVLAAAGAVNIKPQLQPLIFILFWIVGFRLIFLCTRQKRVRWKYFLSKIPLAIICSALIFATPIKNTVLYSNPLYPIRIEIAGTVLNHEMIPETYKESNRPQKWLNSVLEINTPPWSSDQWNKNDHRYIDRAGGFFNIYVVFNLILLLAFVGEETVSNSNLVEGKKHNALIASSIIFLISLYAANFPQSHELRYLMFWMIVLVSFNLCLLISKSSNIYLAKSKRIKSISLLYLVFLIVMCTKIQSNYLLPQFKGSSYHLNQVVDKKTLARIIADKRNCIISSYSKGVPIRDIFYYSSYFYPGFKAKYGIEVAPQRNSCQSKIIINSKL